ncbi:GNAT family N-acetyltransferase [Fretibacter rubidus]|uniref:GNAT family N-acetyltransferase n=1 Tax=Fretibacter rubidus TaxID=570162 RepID=UPI00352AACEB
MSQISIINAKTKDDIAAVKAVFIDYMAFIEDYLGQSLCFQGTDAEFATFPDIYDALLLVRLDGEAVAACGIKPFKPGICELKRLYCRPAGRGHRLGQRLTERAISQAKTLGYSQMFLDTDAGLTHANKIYEALGFKDIDRYYDNPMGCSRYMALDLKD